MDSEQDFQLVERAETYFARKRRALLEDYALADQPVLLMQCGTIRPAVIYVAQPNVCEAIQEGASTTSQEAWWHSFHSGRALSRVFDGVASAAIDMTAGWVTEVHEDAHIAAAIWAFPPIHARVDDVAESGIGDFYAGAFQDFARLVRNVYQAADYSDGLVISATLQMASELPMLVNNGRTALPAPKRPDLHWPIYIVRDIGRIAEVSAAMATRLLAAYGKRR